MTHKHVRLLTALLASLICLCAAGKTLAQTVTTVASPNGRLRVDFRLNDGK